MTWIVITVGLFRVVGIGWGLPASDGWDNDGVAPRDFLPGLAATFTPGQFYTYPPVHLAILAVLTAPISIVALARAPSLALDDVVGEILGVPYMTAFAYVARLVSVAMSLGAVVLLARIAEEIRAHELGLRRGPEGQCSDERVRRAGYFAAAVAGINASFTYYAHTSNLDVPYLFWATWSLLAFTRAITQRTPRLLRRAFVFAALAVGTKDQAYAMFLLSLPLALVAWVGLDEWGRANKTRVLREAAVATLVAALLLALVDGAITNPSGFAARVRFLTGSASQDYAEYTADWSGRLEILLDGARKLGRHYPVELGALFVFGAAHLVVMLRRVPPERRGAHLVVALFPLLVAVSFTVAFNFTARRTDPRFFLPQTFVLAIYGARAMDAIASAARRELRLLGRAALAVVFARGMFLCAAVDANLLLDPRYDVERWLAEHVEPGDTIETYGLNVYLPRMPAGVRVIRVGPEPLDGRNPMPGVEEVQGAYHEAPERGARWIVVNMAWMWRYLVDPQPGLGDGRKLAETRRSTWTNEPTRAYFEELMAGTGAFATAHVSTYDDRVFPIVDVHGTTGRWIWVYERKR